MSSASVETTDAVNPAPPESPSSELSAEALPVEGEAKPDYAADCTAPTGLADGAWTRLNANDALAEDVTSAVVDAVAPGAMEPEQRSVEAASAAADDALSAELQRLVDSFSTVEELSRRAREAAITDLAQYESLAVSSQQYAAGLDQASALEDRAACALESAFGQSAVTAAQELLADARRVRSAFAQLADAWRERVDAGSRGNPGGRRLHVACGPATQHLRP